MTYIAPIIMFAAGSYAQYKFDIVAKIKSAIDWLKGLFNRD